MIATAAKILDELLMSSETNTAFWVLLASVGLVALLFGVKLVLQERSRNKLRPDRYQ